MSKYECKSGGYVRCTSNCLFLGVLLDTQISQLFHRVQTDIFADTRLEANNLKLVEFEIQIGHMEYTYLLYIQILDFFFEFLGVFRCRRKTRLRTRKEGRNKVSVYVCMYVSTCAYMITQIHMCLHDYSNHA